MTAKVLNPGLLSSLQDAGRDGFRHLGVGCCGAADRAAYELSQRLLGATPPFPPAVEITLLGPTLTLQEPALIALTGAPIEASVADQALPLNRPVHLPAGSVLRLGRVSRGCRSYLAVAGGWQVMSVLGSTSTDLRAGFGGHAGRALRSGDCLDYRAAPPTTSIIAPNWSLRPAWTPPPESICSLRFVADPVHGESARALTRRDWRIAADSNRQGLRLLGDALEMDDGGSAISAPVLPGTIQLPSSGLPIVLGVDAQTVGGYPVLGKVIDADLDRLAQMPLGGRLHFVAVEAGHAWEWARRRRAQLARAALAVNRRLQQEPRLSAILTQVLD